MGGDCKRERTWSETRKSAFSAATPNMSNHDSQARAQHNPGGPAPDVEVCADSGKWVEDQPHSNGESHDDQEQRDSEKADEERVQKQQGPESRAGRGRKRETRHSHILDWDSHQSAAKTPAAPSVARLWL